MSFDEYTINKGKMGDTYYKKRSEKCALFADRWGVDWIFTNKLINEVFRRQC